MSYRKPNELFVVALHSSEHFLTVALQLLQLLLNDSSIQRLALLYEHLSLVEDVLNLGCSEGDLLLERLWERRKKSAHESSLNLFFMLNTRFFHNLNLKMHDVFQMFLV